MAWPWPGSRWQPYWSRDSITAAEIGRAWSPRSCFPLCLWCLPWAWAPSRMTYGTILSWSLLLRFTNSDQATLSSGQFSFIFFYFNSLGRFRQCHWDYHNKAPGKNGSCPSKWWNFYEQLQKKNANLVLMYKCNLHRVMCFTVHNLVCGKAWRMLCWSAIFCKWPKWYCLAQRHAQIFKTKELLTATPRQGWRRVDASCFPMGFLCCLQGTTCLTYCKMNLKL